MGKTLLFHFLYLPQECQMDNVGYGVSSLNTKQNGRNQQNNMPIYSDNACQVLTLV
jgi:hypothetical protein